MLTSHLDNRCTAALHRPPKIAALARCAGHLAAVPAGGAGGATGAGQSRGLSMVRPRERVSEFGNPPLVAAAGGDRAAARLLTV